MSCAAGDTGADTRSAARHTRARRRTRSTQDLSTGTRTHGRRRLCGRWPGRTARAGREERLGECACIRSRQGGPWAGLSAACGPRETPASSPCSAPREPGPHPSHPSLVSPPSPFTLVLPPLLLMPAPRACPRAPRLPPLCSAATPRFQASRRLARLLAHARPAFRPRPLPHDTPLPPCRRAGHPCTWPRWGVTRER